MISVSCSRALEHNIEPRPSTKVFWLMLAYCDIRLLHLIHESSRARSCRRCCRQYGPGVNGNTEDAQGSHLHGLLGTELGPAELWNG